MSVRDGCFPRSVEPFLKTIMQETAQGHHTSIYIFNLKFADDIALMDGTSINLTYKLNEK
ncbi:hypothetical protein DPMN_085342 [Dreissena polymorpha]|uniref:Uncharacterized protein n=1 Tax=Dreissena polymorpha TaxID=45954 RepID=A0A9D3YG97_DREPO|nr:hypothetical protein DPMN_085342 [Dreissena polymorpha]